MGRKKKEKPLVLEVDKPKRAPRKHSDATRALISERRRARTVQPRNISQSSKRKFFYDELLKDYGKDPKLKKWIDDHKYELGYLDNVNDFRMLDSDYERWGCSTEYREMYTKEYEQKCADILYSDERTPTNESTSDPWEMIDTCDYGEDTFDNGWLEDE